VTISRKKILFKCYVQILRNWRLLFFRGTKACPKEKNLTLTCRDWKRGCPLLHHNLSSSHLLAIRSVFEDWLF
jgi:hypothetical protein